MIVSGIKRQVNLFHPACVMIEERIYLFGIELGLIPHGSHFEGRRRLKEATLRKSNRDGKILPVDDGNI